MENLTRRDFVTRTAAGAAAFALGNSLLPSSLSADSPPKRPNILFMICDDLNTNLGTYGDAEIHSPNIDRLAKRALRFDRMYCQYPQCAPNRTALLTGLRPDTTRVFDNFTKPTQLGHLKDRVTLPEYFSKQGYFTAACGKVAHHEDFPKWDQRISNGGADEEKEKGKGNPTNSPDDKMPDGVTARKLAALIKQPRDKPFFIAAGFHKPHTPLICPKPYFDKYDPKKFELISPPPGYNKTVPAAALETSMMDRIPASDRRQAIWAYSACISFVDAQIGLLLDAVEQAALWDNTIIVLTADHGMLQGEHGRFGKQSLFEPAAHIPLIIAAPGKQTGACPRLVESVDLYPTLADLAGLPSPSNIGLEGHSFAPLLTDPNRPWKSAAFTVTARTAEGDVRKKGGGNDLIARSLRTEQYVYNDWGKEGTELYDHHADPHEYKNLAHDPKYATIMADLSKKLKEGWKGALPGA